MAERPKRIAIIGGGITGLTAAYDLLRQQDEQFAITIYEAGRNWVVWRPALRVNRPGIGPSNIFIIIFLPTMMLFWV
ncbi:MAG: FAD-dependent oxidoreductase [Caldilineaceae bacterium]